MTAARFPTELKLKCAQRELQRRRRAYPHKVMTKRMSRQNAETEIAIMAEIVADYEHAIEAKSEQHSPCKQYLLDLRGRP